MSFVSSQSASLPSAFLAMRASTLRFFGKVSALSIVTMVTSFFSLRASVASAATSPPP